MLRKDDPQRCCAPPHHRWSPCKGTRSRLAWCPAAISHLARSQPFRSELMSAGFQHLKGEAAALVPAPDGAPVRSVLDRISWRDQKLRISVPSGGAHRLVLKEDARLRLIWSSRTGQANGGRSRSVLLVMGAWTMPERSGCPKDGGPGPRRVPETGPLPLMVCFCAAPAGDRRVRHRSVLTSLGRQVLQQLCSARSRHGRQQHRLGLRANT